MNVNNLASIHIQKCLPGSFGIQVGNCENRGFPWWLAQIVKNHACNARHQGSSPGSESSPGEGNGYPLQYSWLENSKDRGAGQATFMIAKSQTRLNDSHFQFTFIVKFKTKNFEEEYLYPDGWLADHGWIYMWYTHSEIVPYPLRTWLQPHLSWPWHKHHMWRHLGGVTLTHGWYGSKHTELGNLVLAVDPKVDPASVSLGYYPVAQEGKPDKHSHIVDSERAPACPSFSLWTLLLGQGPGKRRSHLWPWRSWKHSILNANPLTVKVCQ